MKQRQSNMEALRIASAVMIVVFHCAYKSGFSFGPGFSVNKLIVKSLWMLGELGVNLFVLLMGYFLVNGRFRRKKFVLLLAEVAFYNILLILAAYCLGEYSYSGKKNLLLSLFPIITNRFWFITAYIILYLFSPYLNLLAKSLTKRMYQRLLLISLALYCVIPTLFGFFYNDTENLLYYNRLIWLLIIYFLGAYIKLHSLPLICTKRRAVWLTLATSAVIVSSILVIDWKSGFFARIGTTEPAYFWQPNTIPMVLLSIGVFGIFQNTTMPYMPVVNRLASTTLGVYLLHDGILQGWLWRKVFCCAAYQASPLLFVRILFSAGVTVVAGGVIDLFRQWLEKHTLSKLLDSELLARLFRED